MKLEQTIIELCTKKGKIGLELQDGRTELASSEREPVSYLKTLLSLRLSARLPASPAGPGRESAGHGSPVPGGLCRQERRGLRGTGKKRTEQCEHAIHHCACNHELRIPKFLPGSSSKQINESRPESDLVGDYLKGQCHENFVITETVGF